MELVPVKYVGAKDPSNVALELYKITDVGAGDFVGKKEGEPEGLVGFCDGLREGLRDGFRDGFLDGLRDGLRDGFRDGFLEGDRVVLIELDANPIQITCNVVVHVRATSSTSIFVGCETVPVPAVDVHAVHVCAA